MKYQEFQTRYPILKSKAQEIYVTYKDQYRNLLNCVTRSTARKEYARGGLGFGLGYYCANSMRDRVIGGIHRGNLLKRVNTAKKPDWEYFFDQSNTLIAAQEDLSNNPIMHFLLYDIDEYVWELVFDSNHELELISVDFFRNCLIELELVFTPHSFGEEERIFKNSRYEAWIFEYQDQDIIEFEYFWDFLYPDKANEFLSKNHLTNQLIRKVYKRHEDCISGFLQYDVYELNETTGERRFIMTQIIK